MATLFLDRRKNGRRTPPVAVQQALADANFGSFSR
jgi:hypothetical protein